MDKAIFTAAAVANLIIAGHVIYRWWKSKPLDGSTTGIVVIALIHTAATMLISI